MKPVTSTKKSSEGTVHALIIYLTVSLLARPKADTVILLYLTPDDFTRERRTSRWERVKT